MKVINFFGGPCTGKSTTAAGLFYFMKRNHKNAELVTEYAKYLVWSNRVEMFKEQTYIFAKQNHKLEILSGKVDFAITDSPLLLSAVYGQGLANTDNFKHFVIDVFNSYDNINIVLKRPEKSEYFQTGRNLTHSEAIEKDKEILNLLDSNNIQYSEVVLSKNTLRDVNAVIRKFY